MSALQAYQLRPDPRSIGRPSIGVPTAGLSPLSKTLAGQLEKLLVPTPTFVGEHVPSQQTAVRLFDTLASFKIRTALVGMHLDQDWRSRLFGQLDSLLAVDEWQDEDLPPSLDSFSTFLRLILLIRPARRPGLGAASNGTLIATWSSGNDQLTIECLPNDMARWQVAVTIEDIRERAAVETPLARLKQALQFYGPERWFSHGG
jgi:hypothetical protein